MVLLLWVKGGKHYTILINLQKEGI